MELISIEFRDFFIRDANEAEYSFGGTLKFGFSKGFRYSEVEVGGGVLLPKETNISEARAKVIENARALLGLAMSVTDDQLQALIIDGQRDPIEDSEKN